MRTNTPAKIQSRTPLSKRPRNVNVEVWNGMEIRITRCGVRMYACPIYDILHTYPYWRLAIQLEIEQIFFAKYLSDHSDKLHRLRMRPV